MSKSRKKYPIIKDRGWAKANYWKIVRAKHKNSLRKRWHEEDFFLENPKALICDWDYCDWIYRVTVDDEHKKHPERNMELYWGTTHQDIEVYKRK